MSQAVAVQPERVAPSADDATHPGDYRAFEAEGLRTGAYTRISSGAFRQSYARTPRGVSAMAQ